MFLNSQPIQNLFFTSLPQAMLPTTNTPSTLNTIIVNLQAEGFVHTFSLIQDEIGCGGPRTLYKPKEIKIVKQNSFRTNPYASSVTVVYAVETNDGFKGILINRRGVYANAAIERFIQKAIT